MLIGQTGAGKSTTINFLMGHTMKKDKNDNIIVDAEATSS